LIDTKVVLIVDDDKSVLRTFSRLLQKSGYDVETAETGKEALKKANKRTYDAILLEFRLPDIDGTDLLGKMHDKTLNAIKIMITGFPSLDLGAKALDIGIDAYVVKPVSPNDLCR
jgi:DNA-binding response OmpR family regulator